jgi:hypothetical protein
MTLAEDLQVGHSLGLSDIWAVLRNSEKIFFSNLKNETKTFCVLCNWVLIQTRSRLPGSLVAQTFLYCVSGRQTKSPAAPNEVDTSLVKSELIYFVELKSALYDN